MHYLLLIHDDETRFARISEEENKRLIEEYGQFTTALEQAGAFKGSDRLRPTSTATTVRVRGGETLTTDGPFAETKEQLGGYYMIEVKDLDEAIRWAAKVPSARSGCVEVRPVWEPPYC